MGNCIGSRLVADRNFTSTNLNNNNSTKHSNSSQQGKLCDYSNDGDLSEPSVSQIDACVDGDEILSASNIRVYSFAELKNATMNFKSDMVLGIGGFGTVYRGWVEEKTLNPSKRGVGILVAIKKLNEESMQGFSEWQAEVDFLGNLSHPNLVKLLGYCMEGKELLLVYEFMQRGSLENHLFGRNAGTETLSWDLRIRIAIGAAKGLDYLHTLEKPVIYRDFKASNILLDGSYDAKISDFGLAKLGPAGENSHVTTRIMGTNGYAAPEYVATGYLYVRSDVYGFGVVLLEMLTGLKAYDPRRPRGQHTLVDWVKPVLPNTRKLKSIMDVRMEGQYSPKAAQQAAQLCLKCLEPEPKNRPPMNDVVEVLEQIAAIAKPKQCKSKSTNTPSRQHGHLTRSLQSPRRASYHGTGGGAGR